MAGKGGAGKVYFVLYLAVILELLIIIVDRDEAEEDLKRKNDRIQLIAETIINSLRGSQTSLTSANNTKMELTNPKDQEREFIVKVSAGKGEQDSVKKLTLLITRNNENYFTEELAGNPKYGGDRDGDFYKYKYTFKPNTPGNFELKFSARTNQVIGVSSIASKDALVKIGSIKLTVGELLEVRDGIKVDTKAPDYDEKLSLRKYIDDLTQGNYENFSSNIGSMAFQVEVTKEKIQVDQLVVKAAEETFPTFVGLELPNPIIVEGATLKDVTVSKVEGPGEFRKVDSVWNWFYAPKETEAGQTYTIKFQGKANRNQGPRDFAAGSFSVTVNKLSLAVPKWYTPNKTKGEVSWTGEPFGANMKYEGLNGSYRTIFTLNGQEVKRSEEATISYEPVKFADEGKTLGLTVMFKSPYMKNYLTVFQKDLKVVSPPIMSTADVEGEGGDVLSIKVIEGSKQEIDEDIEVDDPKGFVNKKGRKVRGQKYDFELTLTAKANAVKKRDGEDTEITLRRPRTGQTSTMTVHIIPKSATPKKK